MPIILEGPLPDTAVKNVIINNQYVLLISMVAALGGLLFGFDTAIISGAIAFIKPYFQLSDFMLGWAVSSILIGCALGAIIAGKSADLFGRKTVLKWCAFLFAVTGVGVALSTSLTLFITFRILGGFAVGAAAMVVPMYIAETVPASLRGRMVSLYQLAIVIGILLAYIANYILSGTGENGWRWMFASQSIPALLFFVCLFFVPETPRWLIAQKQVEKATSLLKKIGGNVYAQGESEAIANSFSNQQAVKIKELVSPAYRTVFFMGCLIAIFQQVTGINAILYYAPEIFKLTGVSAANALLQTIVIGVIMFFATLLAIWLVDKAGRKKLLISGCIDMAVSLIGVSLCFKFQYFQSYIVLIFLVLYIAGFSASLGAVTWVVLSEIFPNRIRGLALSFSTLILWLADFLASFTFPLLNERFGVSNTLLLFSALCVIYWGYLYVKVPETKGKTLEQLEVSFTEK